MKDRDCRAVYDLLLKENSKPKICEQEGGGPGHLKSKHMAMQTETPTFADPLNYNQRENLENLKFRNTRHGLFLQFHFRLGEGAQQPQPVATR